MKYFAHDDNVIWGIGETPEETKEDAMRWITEFNSHRPKEFNEADISNIEVRRCTNNLYDKVSREGRGYSIHYYFE